MSAVQHTDAHRTVLRRLARAIPIPAGAGLARTLVERNIRSYRHGWLTLVSGFFEPIFYLFSLGVGMGALVGDVDAGGGRMVEYASFVAPALMASAAMNGAVFDSTFNVFFKLKYAKLYDSVLATPLGPRDVAVGEISWALLRGLLYSSAFLLVAAVAGVVESWWALLTIPAATLIGFAFAAVGMAATTFMRSWQDFEYVSLSILPMFLFSATFFPLERYPEALQWVVQATPLYHGVGLVRDLMLGDVGVGLFAHVLYLAVMGLVGVAFAARRVERLLLT
ncbi:ABC transporter permease [Phytoactinopolyspora endophytica]|uniref:ABC transporter permease n=1 Tax=Phytoactinopolyspora endophytica TaxID=1642495 RepID=UPI00101D662B|nr:ABC transporter permease [Phytoactinopolyspora endophytica]